MENWFNYTESETYEKLATSEKGLTEQEVAARLEKHGANKLDSGKKIGVFARFMSQFKDVMIIVLLCAAAISAVVAIIEKQYTDFIDVGIILVIVILNAVIGTVQECKAESSIEALKKISQPFSKVRRNGEVIKIESEKLVPGDIVILEAGDMVPADLRLTKVMSLKAESAALTGESVSEEKFVHKIDGDNIALADRDNMLFSSGTVTYGRGEGVVVETGMNTQIGKIAVMLNASKETETPIQKKLNKTGKFISIAVIVIAVLVFLVGVLSKIGTGNLGVDLVLNSFMTAVALAVAAIPESVTAVITIIMSFGVQRLSKKNAIIKKLPAVETLGSTDIICSDKTGTLTLNKMTVKKYYTAGMLHDTEASDTAEFTKILECMVLCNDTIVKHENDKVKFLGDPTETALIDFAAIHGVMKTDFDTAHARVDEIPFDSERKLMTTVNEFDGKRVVYTKGAPDMLLSRCSQIMDNGKIRAMTDEDRKSIAEANALMGDSALRVLAYAFKTSTDTELEDKLVFVGLSGMIDPPRAEVKDAVAVCKSAGITPVMITGDHMNTAFAIARELNIATDRSQVMTGSDLSQLSDEQLKVDVERYRVYARVAPEDKVRIVKAWQSRGKIVAMTGDGVNDAPSIKAADIGIGMGITGTEVTKDAADMVLTDDNFATIVSAVREGRAIYANMQKTIQYLLAANVAEVLSLFLATVIFAFTKETIIFLLPIQILWVNLVTDSFPALALGMEPPDNDIMSKSPHKSSDNLFAGKVGVNIIYQGILQTTLVLGVFLGCAYTGWGHEVGTTMSFLVLCFVQLFHSFNARNIDKTIFNKNFFKNKTIFLSLFVGVCFTLLVSLVPAFHDIFKLQWLDWKQWLTVIGLSISIIPAVEIVKLCTSLVNKARAKR